MQHVLSLITARCRSHSQVSAVARNKCQGSQSLQGSGITIYVLQAGTNGVNASLRIDGGAPKYNVLRPPPGPNFYTPNVTLFNTQGITTGNHTATMTLQNWDNGFSGMMFDYALINQTVVPTTTTSSVASSTVASRASTTTSKATLSPTLKAKSTHSQST